LGPDGRKRKAADRKRHVNVSKQSRTRREATGKLGSGHSQYFYYLMGGSGCVQKKKGIHKSSPGSVSTMYKKAARKETLGAKIRSFSGGVKRSQKPAAGSIDIVYGTGIEVSTREKGQLVSGRKLPGSRNV